MLVEIENLEKDSPSYTSYYMYNVERNHLLDFK